MMSVLILFYGKTKLVLVLVVTFKGRNNKGSLYKTDFLLLPLLMFINQFLQLWSQVRVHCSHKANILIIYSVMYQSVRFQVTWLSLPHYLLYMIEW